MQQEQGIESGEFICPDCGKNGMANYLKWQNKQKRWIFYKKDEGWEYKGNAYRDHDDNEFFTLKHTENVNECWDKYEGERAEYYIFPEHTGMFWKCDYCNYKSRNFQDFLLKKMEKNNIIEGIIEANNDDNPQEDVLLFKNNRETIEVYLNDEKINDNKAHYNKLKKREKNYFKIIFKYQLTNFDSFFENCSNIVFLDFSNFDTSNISNMRGMFKGCQKLKEIKGINQFNTNNVTDMSAMFYECKEIEYLDLSNFNTSNVTKMLLMFSDCCNLKEIKGINQFNTTKVKDLGSMFCGCNELKNLDLSSFDTSNVIYFNGMLSSCKKLKEIKGINQFNTSKAIETNYMFCECNELESLDLSNFNTSKVNDISFMFDECSKLKKIKGLDKFNTINVTKMKGTFQNCSELENLDLSNFNTSKVIDMSFMFNGCSKLKEIKGTNWFNTINVTDMSYLFGDCKELEFLDLSNFNTS